MRKFLHVVRHEYTRHVFRKRFLLGLFSIPLFILIMLLALGVVLLSGLPKQPVGYVDLARLLDTPIQDEDGDIMEVVLGLTAIETENQAKAALQTRQIAAYYVLDPDYLQTGRVRLVSRQEPSAIINARFEALVRDSILKDQSPEISQRLIEGDNLTIISTDGSRRLAEDNWGGIIVPALFGVAFIAATFTTTGYLSQGLTEEKENRTMEVLITSIPASSLILGKTIGLTGVGLTQLFVWASPALLLLIPRPGIIGNALTQDVSAIDLALLAANLVPAFITIAALTVLTSAMVSEVQEGQQLVTFFPLLIMMPLWFLFPIIKNPDGLLATVLSIFPLTAPLTLTIRVAITSVPVWQMILCALIQTTAAVITILLAGRAFRLGMLEYHQRLSWRRIIGLWRGTS